MIIFTSHVKPGSLPVLVREGFSWGAAIFGWIWLMAQGAWVPGLLALAGAVAALWAAGALGSAAPLLALFLVQGVFGRDLVRWSLALRGYAPGLPVAAASHDGALLRLLSEQPALYAVAR
jgi:hypothetical protein